MVDNSCNSTYDTENNSCSSLNSVTRLEFQDPDNIGNCKLTENNVIVKEEHCRELDNREIEALGEERTIKEEGDNSEVCYYEIHIKKEILDTSFTCKKEESLSAVHLEEVDIKEEADEGSGQMKRFTCNLCGNSYRRANSLRAHVRVVHKKTGKLHKCDRCQKKFKWAQNLNRHIKLHSGNKLFNCEFCSYKCTQKHSLKVHQLRHVEKKGASLKCLGEANTKKIEVGDSMQRKKFTCDRCHKSFNQVTSLRTHISIIHKTGKIYECEQCPLKFKWKQSFRRHLRVHTGERPFQCEICNCKFSTTWTLKTHQLTHSDEKYPCDKCKVEFKNKQCFQRHLAWHLNSVPAKCEICRTTYAHQRSLKAHIRLFHRKTESVKAFNCSKCNKQFNTKSKLNSHLKVHSNAKPFRCDICQSQFRDKSTLRKHRLIHTGEKRFQCDVCDAKFRTSGLRSTHRKTHSDEKRFACEVCGVKYKAKISLKIHSQVHTAETPLKCDKCDKQFFARQTLQRHLKTHADGKPYQCKLCDSRFLRKSYLRDHLVIHSGVKPFECDACGAKFVTNSRLTRHKKTHDTVKRKSEGESFQCEVCDAKFRRLSFFQRHQARHPETVYVKEEPEQDQ